MKNKLRSIDMTRSDTVTTYLMKIIQIPDQLAAVGEKVADEELVNMALNSFPASWNHLSKVFALIKKFLTL